jgi:hypothetical protein
LGAADCAKEEALDRFITNFVAKFAQQIARMRAMRVIHGSVSPSNIALSGEVLDFGMSTSVASYGNLVTARGNPSVWQQQLPVLDGLAVLLTCLVNHGFLTEDEKTEMGTRINKVYRSSFMSALQTDFLRLSGFLAEELTVLSEAEKNQLFHFFISVASDRQEPMKVLCSCPSYAPHLPTRTGKFDFFEVMRILTNADISLPDKLIGLTAIGIEKQKCVRALELFETTHARNANGATQRKFTNRNAMRLNQPVARLFGFNLNAEIDAELAANTPCTQIITNVLADVEPKLSLKEFGKLNFTNFEGTSETIDFDSKTVCG